MVWTKFFLFVEIQIKIYCIKNSCFHMDRTSDFLYIWNEFREMQYMKIPYLLFIQHLEDLKYSIIKGRNKKEAYNDHSLTKFMNSLSVSVSAHLYLAVKLQIQLRKSLIFLEPSKTTNYIFECLWNQKQCLTFQKIICFSWELIHNYLLRSLIFYALQRKQ